MNTIKLLKSSNAVIIVLVLALLAQMPHAQYVLYSHSRELDWWSWGESAIGAIALEIAVLVFTVRGNVRVSWGFAAFSVSINLIYYFDASSTWWIPSTSWLLSAGLPVAIALYSHEVMEPPIEDEQKTPPKRVTRTVRVTHTDEQSEQYTVVQPEQITIETEHTVQPIEIDLSTLSDEQKHEYVLTMYSQDPKLNKSALAKQLKIGRTTLYAWIAEVAV